MWVDTHAHLQLTDEPPRDLLRRAVDVEWLVVPGIDAPTSEAALALAGAHPGRILPAAGVHPHHAHRWADEADAISRLASRAAAVGETGLDFYRDLSPRADQLDAFRAQAELAVDLGKPLIVHCRDAFAQLHEVISRVGCGPCTVLHCWTGGPRWTRRFLDLGVTFSFAGPITYETGDVVRSAAGIVPPDRALVETDTPYLTPPPHRSEPNEPANVRLVGEALAAVWGMEPADVAIVTSRNAGEVFGR